MAWKKIEQIALTSSAASVTFSGIPQTYESLKLVVSARSTDGGSDDILLAQFNGTVSGYSNRILYGTGSSAGSGVNSYSTVRAALCYMTGTTSTANTFGSAEITIPNYAGSTAKPYLSDSVDENNATASLQSLWAGLCSSTAAITSLTLTSNSSSNLVANSTFTLYGLI